MILSEMEEWIDARWIPEKKIYKLGFDLDADPTLNAVTYVFDRETAIKYAFYNGFYGVAIFGSGSCEFHTMDKVDTEQAANELQMNVNDLRHMMQADELPIGYVVKRPGSKRCSYIIDRGLLDDYKKWTTKGIIGGFRVYKTTKEDEIEILQYITEKIYPNDPCPCGSGKKYKKCCGKKI